MKNALMEKRCEFCTALCPIVYCKADAAHLCLSCDSKVHSANALSYRHPRTLVCESCRYYPALVRCFDHEMFMCQSCDTSHHVSFQHQKRVISCYIGCPSAKDLAALWGFDLNKLDDNSSLNSNVAKSLQSQVSTLASDMDSMVSVLYTESSRKVGKDNHRQEINYLILQQIQELERLQLSEGLDNSCLVNAKQRTGGLAFKHDTAWKFSGQLDFQSSGNPLKVKSEEPLSSPFSQLDNLTSTGNLLQGDSYWQCKSPLHNNEIWLQNMQDLGVCDEAKWMDDVNIPDVDLTFRNFEELFGSEHEHENNMASSTFTDFERGCASMSKGTPGPNNETLDRDQPHPLPMRSSYSASSFSVSRMTGESSGSEYKDDGVSSSFPTKSDGKGNVIMRHREKKIMRHEKQAQQHRFSRSKSDVRKRGRGDALMKVASAADLTRSF